MTTFLEDDPLKLDVALSILGTIKAYKILNKIKVPEDMQTLYEEEEILYGVKGTQIERMAVFEKTYNVYAPIIKQYHSKK